ncbi:MAG: LysR family transcriptional regulator [Oligoflexia bacterium]|nr:LysR family transcriptional regulator [Oligoflexia bacterium]
MNQQWINYHHLFYFKTIAEEGSVSKAAERLRLGQPTLSAQLKQFEDVLGITLFERHHRKLILTEQGKIALDYARNIFKMGSEMYEVLHDRVKPLKPIVNIGSLDSIPKSAVLQLVKSALDTSSCQIILQEGRADELLRELCAHRIDLVVSNFLPLGQESREIVHRSLSKTNVSFYGTKKFQSLKKSFPYSLSGAPMILPTYDSKLRYDLDHWAKVNKIDLNILVESQDISVKKLIAEEELGVIPMAVHAQPKTVSSKKLIEIGQAIGVYEELFLLSMKRKVPNPISSVLFEKYSFTSLKNHLAQK